MNVDASIFTMRLDEMKISRRHAIHVGTPLHTATAANSRQPLAAMLVLARKVYIYSDDFQWPWLMKFQTHYSPVRCKMRICSFGLDHFLCTHTHHTYRTHFLWLFSFDGSFLHSLQQYYYVRYVQVFQSAFSACNNATIDWCCCFSFFYSFLLCYVAYFSLFYTARRKILWTF